MLTCRRLAGLTGALLLSASLVACTTAPEDDDGPPAAVVEPAEEPSDDGEVADPVEDAEPVGGAPSPDACDDIRMVEDRQYAGAALSGCISALLVAWGTGREYMDDGDFVATVEFVYTEDVRSFDVEMDGDVSGRLRVIGTDSWFDRGAGWEPDDTMGPLYAALSDPAALFEIMLPDSTWTVQPERELISLPNGDDVEAWAVTLDEGYALEEMEVEAWTLWFADDLTPVGNSGTSAMWGVSATTTQILYDLGDEDIVIEPPV
ncbi:hypothetical protein [Isoptericola croceus]|uniref:hypothetical protein n=1 Tax=Isoptericola croceus TaxID=3031406 RepID=UPI0023F90A37|nr:hypothetical protein [Isoptericola croceus]